MLEMVFGAGLVLLCSTLFAVIVGLFTGGDE